MEYAIGAVAVLAVLAIVTKFFARRTVILEYERALLYHNGKFRKVIGPGSRWYFPFRTKVQKVDIRPRFESVSGQEVLSSDGVTLKVSLAATYEISDPAVAVNSVADYNAALYMELQLALREIIGGAAIDDVLEKRGDFSKRLIELTEPKARHIGLKLISVGIKDIMFPGSLKDMFSQVVLARKQGLAALERARGETAALRNLANAAKMMEGNPALMQLRMLQSVEGGRGNTLVVTSPNHKDTLPLKTDASAPQA